MGEGWGQFWWGIQFDFSEHLEPPRTYTYLFSYSDNRSIYCGLQLEMSMTWAPVGFSAEECFIQKLERLRQATKLAISFGWFFQLLTSMLYLK